jgi:hypothetical protein
MTETKTAQPTARYTADELKKLANSTPFEKWADVFNKTEAAMLRGIMKATGFLPTAEYSPKPMDGLILKLKVDASDDAKKLLAAIETVVQLGTSHVKEGFVFDLRFDNKRKGYCKVTAQQRKVIQSDGELKTVLVIGFNEWKGLPTLDLNKSF